jgi:putative spermidine/putrescine transport system substrate-binding protein
MRKSSSLSLRVTGRSELLPLPIQERAVRDLGFPVAFDWIDGIEGLQRGITRPESFDVYLQWRTVDLIWTACCIQPIDIARLRTAPEITAAARSKAGASKVIDAVFDKLVVQPDNTPARTPSRQLSMLPLVHGVDSIGYLAGLDDTLHPGESASWGWMLDPRRAGQVGISGDPVPGMIDAALAVEATRGISFCDIGNLTVKELDAVAEILIHKRKIGHFKGIWTRTDDAVRLVQRDGVRLQTIFSPAAAQLRGLGVPIVIPTPSEGCRGRHSDLCNSAATTGDTLDAAYAFLNWCQDGWVGACRARRGCYRTSPDRIRAHLDPAEWDC